MITHLELCSITHWCCEVPSICWLQRIKPISKNWVESECQEGGKGEGENRDTGIEMDIKKKRGKCWKGRESWQKKKSRRFFGACWMRSGLVDWRRDLCPALHLNFWVAVGHLYHLLVLTFTFCKISLVVLTLLWDAWMGKARQELRQHWLCRFVVLPLLSQHLANGTLPFHL